MEPTGAPADSAIVFRGAAVALPDEILSLDAVLGDERARYDAQMSALGPALRERIEGGLGIESVRVHRGLPSTLALTAAEQALRQAGLGADEIRLVVDFSTLPGDHLGVWSLANRVQGELGCSEAMALSTSGGGCAGFHVALRVSRAMMLQEPAIDHALLIASDCVSPGSRTCLPISVLGDAASAVILSRSRGDDQESPRLLSVLSRSLGEFHDVVVGDGVESEGRTDLRISIEGERFERGILPLHFVISHRILARALREAQKTLEQVDWLAYPNSTDLDRRSVARALGIPQQKVCGPGPRKLGHAFASDMIINALPWLERARDARKGQCLAFLAVGSGFTWGAAIVEG